MNNVPWPTTLADQRERREKTNHKLVFFQLCALRLAHKFRTYPYGVFMFLPVKSFIINEINTSS
jgi:hypothetical protein